MEGKMVSSRDKIKCLEKLVCWVESWIEERENGLSMEVGGKEGSGEEVMFNGRVGSGGGDGSGDEWIGCLDLVKD